MTQAHTLLRSYTLGHDVISQWDNENGLSYFLYDGHGSTRGLLNAATVVQQRYAYDAFGIMLMGTGLTPSGNAWTRLLYSGEQTDRGTGLQYLRARYYDPRNGRFASLDPFNGTPSDPQSLHRYLYVHGDPISGVDPTGQFEGLVGLLGSINISSIGRAMNGAAVQAAKTYAVRTVENVAFGSLLGAAFGGAIAATDPRGDVSVGILQGAKWGAIFGAVPPSVWKTPIGRVILAYFAFDALDHGVGSIMAGNIAQGLLYFTGGALTGMSAIPGRVPRTLYAYVPKEMN